MPSETVYDHTGNVDIRVSWGNDGSGTVQVVTQAAKCESVQDPTDRVIGIVNKWLADADMPLVDVAELRSKLRYEPHFDGWWATLNDWADCNRLIRTLRRARDKAFGEPA